MYEFLLETCHRLSLGRCWILFDFVGRVENLPLNAAVVAGVVGAGVDYLLSAGGENPTNFRRLVSGFQERRRYFGEHWKNGLWITV
jgi:hypothetical protein